MCLSPRVVLAFIWVKCSVPLEGFFGMLVTHHTDSCKMVQAVQLVSSQYSRTQFIDNIHIVLHTNIYIHYINTCMNCSMHKLIL